MSLDWLTAAVSDDEPCGPDLAEIDDSAFVDYYYEAEANMPERYFTPGIKGPGDDHVPGVLFDPKSIRHDKEKETIVALLKRSRDLRLLSLLARQQILAGRLEGYVEAISAIASLLEVHSGSVHPVDNADRRSALEELANATTVCTAIQYVNVAGSAEITYRRYLAASGQSDPRAGEVGLQASGVLGALSAPGNKAVDQAHKLLSAALAGLGRIKAACLRGDRPFTPALSAAEKAIGDVRALLEQARGDLREEAAVAALVAAPDMPNMAGDNAAPVAAAPTNGPARQIANKADARQMLGAIELYFFRNEASSAALLLVTQARLLIGKPLVEAIETLLPEDAGKVRIDFGPETGFSMSMDRLRMLSAELSALAPAEPEDPPGPPPNISSRADVAASLRGLDEYFRQREPASPIPLLLNRARAYLEKDFSAIVAELLPARAKT